jgi:Ca2+-binding EF-hand superfamily protein
MKYYDIDQDGNIGFEEFIRGLKDPLSERRANMVKKAFQLMDKDGRGTITVSDIEHVYDVSQNSDFQEGKKTKEEILVDFLSGFEGMKGNRDGVITWEEFSDYYSDLSMSIPDDIYFVRMMESIWCMCEDEESDVNKDHVKHLVQLLRTRLQTLSTHDTSDEYVLRKIFNECDGNKSGDLTIDELWGMMAKFGISCERKYVTSLLNQMDTNKNGIVEFEEFVNFVIHRPYK